MWSLGGQGVVENGEWRMCMRRYFVLVPQAEMKPNGPPSPTKHVSVCNNIINQAALKWILVCSFGFLTMLYVIVSEIVWFCCEGMWPVWLRGWKRILNTIHALQQFFLSDWDGRKIIIWLALCLHISSFHGSAQWLSTVQQLSPLFIDNETME